MREKHLVKCKAPICVSSKKKGWKKNLVWYPGEKVCDRRPLTKVQKFQKEINKLRRKKKFKYTNHYFTYEILERKNKITELTRGKDPNKK
jgi:hypothetical protein